MFEQPDEFRFVSTRDRRRPLRHDLKRAVIAHQAVAHAPFNRRGAGGWKKTDGQIVARVNYPLTHLEKKRRVFSSMSQQIG